jgi:hypothetical protein
MHACKNLLLGFLLSALAATAHAIDGRGLAVDSAARHDDIDSSIKTELKRILRESLPAYLVVQTVGATPAVDCARTTAGVAVVLSKRVSQPSCPRFSDSIF